MNYSSQLPQYLGGLTANPITGSIRSKKEVSIQLDSFISSKLIMRPGDGDDSHYVSDCTGGPPVSGVSSLIRSLSEPAV